MARVKIKTNNNKDPRRKFALLNILSSNDIYPTNIIIVQDGFVIISSDEEQEKIFQDSTKQELLQNDFTLITPPELKAKRTVIAFNINSHIYSNSEDDMINELYAHNTWLDNNIDTIFKFPNSKTIKITFTQAIYAQKAIDHGLKLFSMKIPHYQIQQEKFYQIQTCYRCYEIEDHLTKHCPKNQDYKVCPECAEEGHTWKHCNKEGKKCINCGENHRTLSMRCCLRKDGIKKKREEEKNRGTYSEITKMNANPINITTPTPLITREEHLKIYSCVMNAHFMNVSDPGCYEKELNTLLADNNLPPIKISKTPNSSKLLAMIVDVEKHAGKDIGEASASADSTYQQETTNNNTKQQQETARKKKKEKGTKKLDSEDIDLEIYTKESKGWPENITLGQLIKGIEEGNYKFTNRESTLEPHEVLGLMKKGDMILGECLKVIDDSIFRKIRSGQTQERSPPSRQPQRLRKKDLK
ncbi:hypothetical protein E2C01_042066 [Portunus trituberculatus]|uniref:Nucleic-acid-binding protein from transposon X-element n=1 Tax=Portunus trituberculatus TaxID=210409 RepID=A0A5B7FTJ9_PORTR|nr:hypothetical protein [Portunus trituberculatus]